MGSLHAVSYHLRLTCKHCLTILSSRLLQYIPTPQTNRSWDSLVQECKTNAYFDVDMVPCEEETCSGNGRCFYDDNGMRYCSCDRGYTGNDCSAIANSCEPNPCHSSATCEDLHTSFKCQCPPHKKGTLCRDGKRLLL